MTSRSFGRYKVAEEVGRGAMGVVYRGIDPMIGRTVAIKAINVSYLDSVGVRTDEYLQRFQREAQVAGRLSHPAIVKIYDLGPNFLVMEFVEGQSLASLLRAKMRWPMSKVLQMIGEAAEALDYAHAQGIVHRDVKPANIMVQPDGTVKVMDFGLARIESSTLTAAGEILGSASYMAPELVLGRTATPRSDIFSLAVVVYELMTGDRPFAGGSVSAIIHKIVTEAPRATAELALNLPPAYDTIFARALAKDPAARYASASEFAGALSAAQWADKDPLLPDPIPTQPPKRQDPAATMPPVPKAPVVRPDEPTMLDSPLANLVSEPRDPITQRAMPPVQLPEETMADKKDEAKDEVPATVILKPGQQKAPATPAPKADAADEVPATVIMKPGAAPTPPATPPPTPQPPAQQEGTERTVILKAPSPESTDKVVPAPAPPPPAPKPPAGPPTDEITAIVRPKVPAPPTEPLTLPATPAAPPAAADTSSTGPIPIVPPPAAKKKGSGLVIGIVAGAVLFLLLAVGGAFWAIKSYLSKRVASIAVVPPEASTAPTDEAPAPPPPTEAAAPPSTVAEAVAEPSPETVQETTEVTQPPAPATVVITSDPPGARVIVGKKERGVTPFRFTQSPGKASISVEKDGYKPFRKDLRLQPGKQETVEARLEAIPRETPPPPAPTTLPPVKTGDLVALTPDVTVPKKLSGESVKLRTSLPKKFNGSVVVEFIVDEDGKVQNPKVVESAGDPKIDGPCVDAVKTYKYEPATLRGVRVKVAQRARFTFQAR